MSRCSRNKASAKWKAKNRRWIRLYNRAYQQLNKKRIAERMRKRYQSDLAYRIMCRLRVRVYLAVKGAGRGRTMALVGCSAVELMRRIESLWLPGMTWENFGGWHIDHIQPCSSFDLTREDEQRECFNYMNLQPLWAKDNWAKSDRHEAQN